MFLCFVFFLNQFSKIISSDQSFVRPHKQFTFLFSVLETPVYHYTRSSSHSLKKKNQKTKNPHFSYPCFAFEALVQMPLLSKHLSLHCPVSASVNVNSHCWFSAPIEIMVVTAGKWHIWATILLPTNWLAKKKEKNPDPLMLAVKHGMSQDGTLLALCHIACEKNDGYAWSLLEACGSWRIMWALRHLQSWRMYLFLSFFFFYEQLLHIWHWWP